ncbi:eCIS core domain-containing protein [Algibacter pacificus]|uniref:eCIS core domain-containing protein n=1 Tax=Algibacter pacificus TaxID=2599389 RepID=UPI0011CAB7BC|nr:DUF4157 domain-containing protein [Algibacter pacificus]
MRAFAKHNPSTNSHTSQSHGDHYFGVQAKLSVGKPNDKYEKEADATADKIVSKSNEAGNYFGNNSFFPPTPKPSVQKVSENEEQIKEAPEQIQEKPLAETLTPVVQLQESEELQEKCEDCEAEEKQIQKLPFEDVQEVSEEEQIQTACDTCEKDESVQQKESISSTDNTNAFPALNSNIQQFPEDIQKKEDEDIQEQSEEDTEVQKVQMSGGDDSSTLESNLSNSKGGGSPLPQNTKNEMESGFGTDFSGVRVHNDSNAVQMNKQLGAQAFTNGNDIYFNEGKYNPTSNSGKHLLAHELTHTVQQGASIQRKLVQKDEENNSDDPLTPEVAPPTGVTPIEESQGEYSFTKNSLVYIYNDTNNELMLPTISISDFKARHENQFTRPIIMPTTARNTNQAEKWNDVIGPSAEQKLNLKISEANRTGGYSRAQNEENKIYFYKGTRDPELIIFGTRTQLLEIAKIPTWDENNNPTTFQIDHIVEHQLGGEDEISNFELLEASANGSSGSSIAWEINRKIKEAYDVFASPYYQHTGRTERPQLPSRPGRANQYAGAFRQHAISFMDFDFDLLTQSGMPDRFWSHQDISQGAHLNKLEALTGDEMRAMGTEDDPALFISPSGGKRINISENDSEYPVNIFPRAKLLSRPTFNEQGGEMRVEAYKSGQRQNSEVTAAYPDMTWPLRKVDGTYIFHLDGEATKQRMLRGAFQSLRLPGMSPIRIDQLELTENGFIGIGKVLPTVPLIADADIDIVIDGDGIRMRKLFTAQEFNFPSPFAINQATLEVSFGTDGLALTGRVDFGINNVGEGHIEAAASTENGFALEGAFNFDSELFDPAEINMDYSNNIWTIGGTIGIPQGKIQGVKNATITASYSENTFTASGEAELDIPGIESGTMNVVYGEEGFSIGGEFQLKNDIPGISGGSVSATISKENGEEGYNIMVSGTAQPAIPGVNTALTITYDNGALTIEGSAAYARGMLSGTVNVGTTNRAIGEDGQPSGDPDDTMRVYGGGSLTLTLTPWLEATAGINFLPNGEIEVTGRIGLPDSVDVFDRKSIERNLFNMPAIEIPIFAIPLGPRSLGLVARITGGLDFSAGFGPGQLRDLYADVTYNPDREDETTITGHGEFAIPADAGLTLRGDLGLGLSVGVASLTGGIEIAGALGLEGEAAAEVDVNWSPQTGLAIDATGRITVNPKFTFDINAFARASLDLWLVSISETWRYNLASFSWGPDIQFGIIFPVHYREGEPFDMSFDDIDVIYPELDIGNMATGLARDVKDDIF